MSGQLYGTRDTLITLLAQVLGPTKAMQVITDFEKMVNAQAAAGTSQAITAKLPEIRRNVRDEAGKLVKPLFYAAVAAGSLGALLGLIGIVRSRRGA